MSMTTRSGESVPAEKRPGLPMLSEEHLERSRDLLMYHAAASGVPKTAIAERFHCCRKTVYNRLRRVEASGGTTLRVG